MRTFLLLLFSVAAYAQTTATTITDTIRIPVSNALFAGTVTIIPSHGMTCGTNSYIPQPTTITIADGVLSTALIPNASCYPVDGDGNPASYYTVRYAGRNFAQSEVWVVPVSGTAVKVSALRSTAPLSSVATISASQILPGAATTGQGLVFNGSVYAPATISATPTAHASSHAAAGSDPLTVAQSQVTNLTTDLGNKEPTISVGTTGQYWRGDKSWQTLNSTAVGLGSVENTALSTWAGSGSITTVGTLASGVLPWSLVTGAPSTYAPSAHATAHQNGGADEIATATAAANAIPKAGADGKLASEWFPTLNQNTTGTAAGLTSQYIDWTASSGGASIANKPTLGAMAAGAYPGDGVVVASSGAWGTSLAIGTDIQAYDADLVAIAALSTAGLVARTGAGTAAARTIQAGSLMSVTNGDGVSGDPSIDVDDTVVTTFLSGTADPTGACTMGTKYHRTDTEETWECPDTAWVKQLGSSHVHAAADTTSGTFDAARIPTLAGSKIDSADKLGTGDKFPMATALGTSGNCAQWGAAGLTDAGAPCGTGGGGGTTGLYSGTIDFGVIYDGGCVDDTFTATGLTTGKTLALSMPSGTPSGVTGDAFASAADTVTVRLCFRSLSGGSVNPDSATYKVREMDALGYLTGSATIDFGTVYDGGCATDTITVTGAATGDSVAKGWPAALEAGLHGDMKVTAANTVTVTLCYQSLSGGSVDPASATFNAAITK